jgi:predicted amidophosphoribosyltransferase
MMATEPKLYPEGPPAGFPHCGNCTYYRGGSPRQCASCVSQSLNLVTEDDHCPICSQVMAAWGCGNWLCRSSTRRIDRIRAIAMSEGPLRQGIISLKYHAGQGWATIFGRLVVGWLDRHVDPDEYDLLIANPTYLGPDDPKQRTYGHTELVLDRAWHEDLQDLWHIDEPGHPTLSKTRLTSSSAGNTADAKREAATELHDALQLNYSVAGKRVLVFDDLTTTGSQLNTIAGYLLDQGAEAVEGLVLARAPWT